MTDLLDINVWLALSSEDHPHHSRVVRYWRAESNDRIALCRITALGFLRLCMNPVVMAGNPFSSSDAWMAYRRFLDTDEVYFAGEPARCEMVMESFGREVVTSSNAWTDVYLAAFAISGNMRMVTFDADFAQFPGLALLHLKP